LKIFDISGNLLLVVELNFNEYLLLTIKTMSPEKMGPSPEEMGIKPEQQDRKAFVGRETVNGVDIVVKWDEGYDDYVIYLPQIELGKEEGIYDQVIRLTRKPEVAKQVFDFATKEAEKTKNVYDLFRSVEKFSKDLPYDDEEDEE
jgi:hypothetical protein